MSHSSAQPEARHRGILLLLCCFAAIKVFVFSAAFPFFSVVDEQYHFDLVARYADGAIPRTLAHISEDARPYIVWFGTAEYLAKPQSQPNGMFLPPPWHFSQQEAVARLANRDRFWRETVTNCEAGQPPLYYVIGGGWWRIGNCLPLSDGDRLIWLRMLNAVVLAALVWLGAGVTHKFFPEKRFIQLAVPALIACFPQSIFYAINSDSLSPVIFGVAFMLLLDFCCTEKPAMRSGLATGLMLAATFLTKLSNLPLLVAASLLLAWKAYRLARTGRLRAAWPALGVLAAGASVPSAGWLVWCKLNFGDITGTAQKIKHLNWTDLPMTEWLHHPIFTPHGFWYFLKGNLASFWLGEQLWHLEPLANPTVNNVVAVVSLVTLISILIAVLRQPSSFSAQQRLAIYFSLMCLAASLAFYALLSIKYDFNDCFYPSREFPYFVSGRLMLGLLIPFLILFAAGLDQLMNRWLDRTKFLVLVAFLVFLLISEVTIDWPVFFSEYNWYHF